MEEQDKIKMSWHKWFVSEAKLFKEVLTNEQMGKLFFAVMETLETGEELEVSEDIKITYKMYLSKIISARKAYENTCKKRAESGQKGGLAKAKNQRKRKEQQSNDDAEQNKTSPFTFPTKTEFKSMAKSLMKDQDQYCLSLEYDDFELTQLYENIKQTEKWFKFPVVSKTMLKTICYAFLADIFNRRTENIYVTYYQNYLQALYEWETERQKLAENDPNYDIDTEYLFDGFDCDIFSFDDILECTDYPENCKDAKTAVRNYFEN